MAETAEAGNRHRAFIKSTHEAVVAGSANWIVAGNAAAALTRQTKP